MNHPQHDPSPTDDAAVSVFTPHAITVGTRDLDVDGEKLASFAITGYPREVHPGWLQPLLTYPGRLDVSLHIGPLDPTVAARRLQKQLAKLESGRRVGAEHGQLADPEVEAATEDAYELADRLARGEGRLFRVGLYLTVHAPDEQALAAEVAAVRSLCASLLLDAKPATFRSLQGWVTCLPLGLDRLEMRRSFDTAALAAAFPFTSPDLPPVDPTSTAAPSGVLYGYNLGSQGLVHWDRWHLDNHNSVVLGRSGAGKSYLVKLETLRSLYQGVEIHVIDPEDEYAALAHAVGGTYVHLGAQGVHLNPLDLPIHTTRDGRRTAAKDAVARRSLFLHTLLAVLLGGELGPGEKAALDQALATTYHQAGLTEDPRTWQRPAPLLGDLRDTLAAREDSTAQNLAARLHPFVDGAFNALFADATTTTPQGHLVVYSLRDVPDELTPAATLLTLDAIWRQVANPAARRRRLVVVDEGWLLMRQTAGARFLLRMAKAARKHWAGLTVCTQDVADVLGSEHGTAVVANAATHVLLRQASQTIHQVSSAFVLSDGERQFLLSAPRGCGLLSDGTHRAAFQTVASPAEDRLATSDPAQLADDATHWSTVEDSYVDLGSPESPGWGLSVVEGDEFGSDGEVDEVSLDP